MTLVIACHCSSSHSYADCCQPLHQGIRVADTAVQLMRSRYSAFCIGDINYLIQTLHPTKRQLNDAAVLQHTIDETHWLGLQIIDHKPSGNQAMVEFVAFYQDESPDISQLHEQSNFIFDSNNWFYRDGQILAPIKLSRNDPCFCGSGKKLKKCHLA